jgi:hypothetical protein
VLGMNQQQLTLAKFLAIGVVLVGGFFLVGMGKLDATTMYSQTTTMVGALVVALGISGAGSAAGTAITSANNARMASMHPDAIHRGQAGFVRASTLGVVCALFALFGVCALLGRSTSVGCTSTGAPSPAVVPAANFAACVLVTAAEDAVAGMKPAQVAIDVVSKCGGSLEQVAQVLDAAARRDAILASMAPTDGGR